MGDILYSVSSNTLNGEVDETQLRSEIIASGVAIPEAALINIVKLDRLGDVLTITHVPTLSVAESGSLTLVVAAHSGSALTGIFTPGPDDELAAHTGDPSAHHTRYTDGEAAVVAGALITIHAGDSSAHHVRYTDAEASGVAVQVATTGILEHANLPSVHHARYTDAEAIAAASGALDHHARYTDQEASGVAVAVTTTGILEHTNLSSAHHARYTDAEAIAAASGVLEHHARYTDAEASGIAVDVVTTGILEHTNLPSAHHVRYTDAEAIAAASGALDHHVRYTDAEASGVAVAVATTGILEHTNLPSAHHTRYTDSEAIAAATGNAALQTAYDAGATGVIRLSSANGPFIINDAGSILDNILQIQNSAGTVDVFKARATVGGTQVELGSHDSLISGSNQPIVRIGDQSTGVQLWPTDRVFTSSPGSLMGLFGSYEHDYVNVSFAALNLQATMENRQAAFAFNHFLLFNNGLTIKNVNGVAANFGPGQTFIAQPTIQADGASISMPQNRDFLSQPRFNVINGGTLTVTTWGQVQLFGQINTGVTMTNRNAIEIGVLLGAGGTLTNERGILLRNLSRGTTIIGIDSELTGASKTFIEHPGTSPSNFGGEIFMADTVPLTLGTAGTDRVSLSHPSAGILRMIGAGGSFNEGLDWDFQNSNNVAVTSSTSSGLNFDLTEIAFGPSTVADGTNNWIFAFSPGLRATQLAGDYSEVLFSSSSSISIAHAIANFATWTINAPTISIGAGSITNAANVLIQTNMSQGTNRYGLLITSNPSGGTLNYALRVTAGDSRFDGRVDINNPVALGGSGVATLGTTGSPGPTGVAQAQWLEVDIAGTPHWIPVWT